MSILVKILICWQSLYASHFLLLYIWKVLWIFNESSSMYGKVQRIIPALNLQQNLRVKRDFCKVIPVSTVVWEKSFLTLCSIFFYYRRTFSVSGHIFTVKVKKKHSLVASKFDMKERDSPERFHCISRHFLFHPLPLLDSCSKCKPTNWFCT